ncbi:MAG: alpha/beta hydrolase [Flavobacteriales bacterium]|nr:alpha/beta hydrolase [Flavobacteriales bacterium]
MPDKIAVKKSGRNPTLPTIVFLHDSLGCIELWRDFPEKLGTLSACNVISYDRRGYGKSHPFAEKQRSKGYMELEADVLINLLDNWQLETAILFGHSDGGSIALIAAGKYPDRISAVITEGAHIFVEDITIRGIRKAIELYKTSGLKSKLTKYHGDKTDELFWAWASTWTKDEFRSWNIESFLPSISCPCLIIQGENDEYGSIDQVEGIIRGTLGYAEKFLIPNVKHTPHKEVPDLILSKSKKFLEGMD